MNLSSGIIGAGNWIVDKTKIIDVYPSQDTLANIESEERNNGGGPFNILVDLFQLGAQFPLRALGSIGQDSEGDWIVDQCQTRSIDTKHLWRHESAPTSYTDVMSVRSSGRRTFFHQRGANRFLGPEHFRWKEMQGRILYLGYLLLLDAMDEPHAIHGTVAAGILKSARLHGFYRVVDLVSVERPDYSEIVNPALPEIDLLICNELEASRVTDIPVRDGSEKHLTDGLREAAKVLLGRGVRDWVVIHLPEGAYARSSAGEEVWQGRVNLPANKIVGTVGAGDAFAAGVLLGLHENRPMAENLMSGVCAAAACLQAASTSGGVSGLENCLAIGHEHGHVQFP
ncbi:MAG: carbohydrate kinase family protein [Chthoniobacterales bacterium]